jgi:hypothetical protein
VDLSAFLERQRISESGPSVLPTDDVDQDDVDHTLAHILSDTRSSVPQKGKVKHIEWDNELDAMIRDKTSAEAAWGERVTLFLKHLRSSSTRFYSRPQVPI